MAAEHIRTIACERRLQLEYLILNQVRSGSPCFGNGCGMLGSLLGNGRNGWNGFGGYLPYRRRTISFVFLLMAEGL